ncbi:unnamed protein product [Anisakis simplex]|uniref:proline--tRNA ligase n=1 Tax=Anisakis simplex TaxID=6269 RepID=A0A0M3JWZ8_ANISI|nr:unnamed protein product [Anisakis simplex]
MVVHRASRFLFGMPQSGAGTKSLSYHLMLEKGLIHPNAKGLFSILPLGKFFYMYFFLHETLFIDKLVRLIENELNMIGALKMSMPTLGAKELWTKVDRWQKLGSEMFRLVDREGKHFCLQPTAEEMITQIITQRGIHRKTMFPFMIYQTTPKFRDEMNPRFGLLRSREFLMNDLYTFDKCREDALKTYDLISRVYHRILCDKLGFNVYVVRADSGNIGGSISHEYHLPSDSGEDSIAYCERCREGVNSELFRRGEKPCSQCDELSMKTISLGRLIAAAIDVLSPDNKSLRLPSMIQPFKMVVIPPSDSSSPHNYPQLSSYAECLVEELDSVPALNNEILLDDRTNYSVGKRLLLASQLGISHIVVVGAKSASLFTYRPLVEYFTVESYQSDPIDMGMISHEELFEIVQNI